MLAALGAVRRLCAELALSAAAQPADHAHLMAPAVHQAAESASLHSSADNCPEAVIKESATPAEAAEAAERAVRDSLVSAQQATAALADAKRLAEVGLHLLSAIRACNTYPSSVGTTVFPSEVHRLWACSHGCYANVQTACMPLAYRERIGPKGLVHST